MSTLPHFPVDCMDSHLRLFSLPRLSCSVSYHRKTTVQNVYKDIKIYIFLCPPSTSDCCFCFGFLLQTSTQRSHPLPPTPLHFSHSFKPEMVSEFSSRFLRFSFALLCNVAPINRHPLKEMHPIQKTPHFPVHTSDLCPALDEKKGGGGWGWGKIHKNN